MHQLRFRLGLRPRSRWGGAYSAPPDPLAGFNGPTSKKRKGREDSGMGRKGRGGGDEEEKGREGRGKKGEGKESPPPNPRPNSAHGRNYIFLSIIATTTVSNSLQ